MILFLSFIVLALLAGYLTGGRLRRFAELELRWWILAPLGFALQAVPLPDGAEGTDLQIRMLVLGASYVLVLLFAVRNLKVVGVPVVVLGLVLNGLVVTLNGGMPVGEGALRASGQVDTLHLLQDDEAAKHHLLTDDDVLTFLGDVVAIGPPIRQVISVGDVFVYAGIAWLIVAIMRGRTPGLGRPPEPERYRGRHRRRGPLAPQRDRPAEAMTSGTEL